MNPQNNRFCMNLKQTHEAYKFVMLLGFAPPLALKRQFFNLLTLKAFHHSLEDMFPKTLPKQN